MEEMPSGEKTPEYNQDLNYYLQHEAGEYNNKLALISMRLNMTLMDDTLDQPILDQIKMIMSDVKNSVMVPRDETARKVMANSQPIDINAIHWDELLSVEIGEYNEKLRDISQSIDGVLKNPIPREKTRKNLEDALRLARFPDKQMK